MNEIEAQRSKFKITFTSIEVATGAEILPDQLENDAQRSLNTMAVTDKAVDGGSVGGTSSPYSAAEKKEDEGGDGC